MPTQEEVIQEVYKYAGELVKAGLTASQVEKKLIAIGLDRTFAASVVRNVFSIRTKAIQDTAKKKMFQGALWCLGGLAVTAVNFSLSFEGEGLILAWGAVIFGALQFMRGLLQYSSQ